MRAPSTPRYKPSDALVKMRESGYRPSKKHAFRYASRNKRAVDGRTRAAQAWKRHYNYYLALAPKHDALARALASCLVQREQLDHAIARGEFVDPMLLVRISGEVRRLMRRIDDVAAIDSEPADITQSVVERIRSVRHEARS